MIKSVRILFIALFFITLVPQANAQVYFGYGYAGQFKSLNGLNEVVKNYNSSRTWLDQEMGNFGYVDGLNINFGAGLGPLWIDMSFLFAAQKKKAFGPSPAAGFATRQIKYRNNHFAFSTGIIAAESQGGVAFGLRSEFGSEKVKTRVYSSDSDKGKWKEAMDSELTVNTGPMIKFFLAPSESGVVTLALFYTFGLIKSNHTDLDEGLNNTRYLDKMPQFDNSLNTFGFSINAGVFGS